VRLDDPPRFADQDGNDLELTLGNGLAEGGRAIVRAGGQLRIAPARELIVERTVRAAFEPPIEPEAVSQAAVRILTGCCSRYARMCEARLPANPDRNVRRRVSSPIYRPASYRVLCGA
jgi:hypothetical protein